jgi:hypothetical protein
MASYAIAHLQIDLLLTEMGYKLMSLLAGRALKIHFTSPIV